MYLQISHLVTARASTAGQSCLSELLQVGAARVAAAPALRGRRTAGHTKALQLLGQATILAGCTQLLHCCLHSPMLHSLAGWEESTDNRCQLLLQICCQPQQPREFCRGGSCSRQASFDSCSSCPALLQHALHGVTIILSITAILPYRDNC
jgi:hypothetical protein